MDRAAELEKKMPKSRKLSKIKTSENHCKNTFNNQQPNTRFTIDNVSIEEFRGVTMSIAVMMINISISCSNSTYTHDFRFLIVLPKGMWYLLYL